MFSDYIKAIKANIRLFNQSINHYISTQNLVSIIHKTMASPKFQFGIFLLISLVVFAQCFGKISLPLPFVCCFVVVFIQIILRDDQVAYNISIVGVNGLSFWNYKPFGNLFPLYDITSLLKKRLHMSVAIIVDNMSIIKRINMLSIHFQHLVIQNPSLAENIHLEQFFFLKKCVYHNNVPFFFFLLFLVGVGITDPSSDCVWPPASSCKTKTDCAGPCTQLGLSSSAALCIPYGGTLTCCCLDPEWMGYTLEGTNHPSFLNKCDHLLKFSVIIWVYLCIS